MEEIKEYLHEFDNANDFYDLYESIPMKYPASVYVEATEYIGESSEGTNVSMTLPFSATSVSLYYGIEENTIYTLYSDGNFLFEGFLRGNSREGVIETIREDGVWAKLWLTKYNEFDSLIFQLEDNNPAIPS